MEYREKVYEIYIFLNNTNPTSLYGQWAAKGLETSYVRNYSWKPSLWPLLLGGVQRGLDNLGNGNILRKLDTLGYGNILRQLDTLGTARQTSALDRYTENHAINSDSHQVQDLTWVTHARFIHKSELPPRQNIL